MPFWSLSTSYTAFLHFHLHNCSVSQDHDTVVLQVYLVLCPQLWALARSRILTANTPLLSLLYRLEPTTWELTHILEVAPVVGSSRCHLFLDFYNSCRPCHARRDSLLKLEEEIFFQFSSRKATSLSLFTGKDTCTLRGRAPDTQGNVLYLDSAMNTLFERVVAFYVFVSSSDWRKELPAVSPLHKLCCNVHYCGYKLNLEEGDVDHHACLKLVALLPKMTTCWQRAASKCRRTGWAGEAASWALLRSTYAFCLVYSEVVPTQRYSSSAAQRTHRCIVAHCLWDLRQIAVPSRMGTFWTSRLPIQPFLWDHRSHTNLEDKWQLWRTYKFDSVLQFLGVLRPENQHLS